MAYPAPSSVCKDLRKTLNGAHVGDHDKDSYTTDADAAKVLSRSTVALNAGQQICVGTTFLRLTGN